MKNIGAYIHIPFCKSKCKYCDFISFENKEKEISRYIKAVCNEIYLKSIFLPDTFDYKINTIYIGGGTPSYIDSKYIIQIIKSLKENFCVDENAEISIEINPGTITEKKLLDYKKAGINRISVGLQTGSERLLKLLSRIHTYEEYENTIKMAKKVGFNNINSDIIIGIPTQTINDAEDTLDKLLKLDLTHISIYSLIIEEGTQLEKEISSGKLKPLDDELERYIYWFAKRKLESKGYIHYEISNFAKPRLLLSS